MGDLILYKTTFANGAYETIWNISDNQGAKWNRKYLEIKSNLPFKVKKLFKFLTLINKIKAFLQFS